jgi:hypothetical protein
MYIYVNTLICHKVGSAQNVSLVIGERLVIGISTLHSFPNAPQLTREDNKEFKFIIKSTVYSSDLTPIPCLIATP